MVSGFKKGYFFVDVSHCNMCNEKSINNNIIGLRLDQSQGLRPLNNSGISITISRCSQCGLIYSNPLPVPLTIDDHYGVNPDEYWTDDELKEDPACFSGEIAKAKELLNYYPGMKALDIGAGLGKCMLAMSYAGFDVEGFEPSRLFRDKALENNTELSPEKLKLGTIEELDYPLNYFDFITFGAVLEHLYDPDKALHKALHWLKEDGVIHIEVPSSDWLIAKLINLAYRLTGSNFVTNLSPMHSPFHLYEFSLKSFKENGKKNGYNLAHYQYYVCRQPYMPKFIQPLLAWYMKKYNRGMQLKVWLRKNT
ncbi:MAG: class I SAM-dependent methyltransferase [Candidatus Electrothrix sp. AUS4]|nr:class I SAM-dependent methyltransferase [Candidatus Electrothrix sp. AUS4]